MRTNHLEEKIRGQPEGLVPHRVFKSKTITLGGIPVPIRFRKPEKICQELVLFRIGTS